ncbi:MAG TPA: YceH family protein, partial [Solirubrobacteraceae bacterium]|nr:YceH family protein [Solirubrobacteraceae bacterium]
MRPPELSAPEQRVLGCLIEKRRTTPDTYPLSINALRLACNQSTNRDPVLDYDEHTVREAAQRLSRRGLARLASGAGSRAIKYRHLAEEGLGLGEAELAVLCVLLLRGPQTPGELKARTERLARIDSLAEIERLLDVLIDRGYVSRMPRRPGLKEDRFIHLLRADEEAGDSEHPGVAPAGPEAAHRSPGHVAPLPRAVVAPRAPEDGLAGRVDALEAEVTALRAELRALREALGE